MAARRQPPPGSGRPTWPGASTGSTPRSARWWRTRCSSSRWRPPPARRLIRAHLFGGFATSAASHRIARQPLRGSLTGRPFAAFFSGGAFFATGFLDLTCLAGSAWSAFPRCPAPAAAFSASRLLGSLHAGSQRLRQVDHGGPRASPRRRACKTAAFLKSIGIGAPFIQPGSLVCVRGETRMQRSLAVLAGNEGLRDRDKDLVRVHQAHRCAGPASPRR
jgi:hypothetical protein